MPRTSGVERVTAADLVELATDVGPVPRNVAVVLELDPVPGGAESLAAEVGRRLATVPRLRRRLVTRRWGRRPCWVDDAELDVARHVAIVAADPAAPDPLLAAAAATVTTPLPRDRPLWRAVVVTDAPDGGAGVVVVIHHVVADGIGGLALLARLVDEGVEGAARSVTPGGAPAPPRAERPGPTVPHPAGNVDAVRPRRPALLGALRRARVELGGARLAPRCSVNAPTGARRRFARVDVDLDSVRQTARRHGATVNDALLVAVTGAMAGLLTHRGETPPAELVVSVPVSARTTTTSADLGNRVGVMPVRVPLDGTPASRIAHVARETRNRKDGARGASAALIGPLFRALAALGLFRRFVDRQRLVNSFLTNLRGPAETLHLGGVPIRRIVPVTITAGNVGVAFAAFSYAGSLGITLIADPDVVPDTDVLAAALDAELLGLGAR